MRGAYGVVVVLMAFLGMCPTTVRTEINKLICSTPFIPSNALPARASLGADKDLSIGDKVEIAGLVIAVVLDILATVAGLLTIKTYLDSNHGQSPSEFSSGFLRERVMVAPHDVGA